MPRDRFELFDITHLVALGIFLLGAVVVVLIGRRRRHLTGPDRVARGLAVVLALVAVPWSIAQLVPWEEHSIHSLPLQLCDVNVFLAVLALWTRHRTLSVITFLWGVTLSTQALITPDLATPFPEVTFIAFWLVHLGGVWAGIYLVWGLGITPIWRDYRIAVLATAVWMISVFVFNLLAGTNYGYVNGKPPLGSVLDYFPPWPWYLLVQVVLVAGVWALIVAGFRPGPGPDRPERQQSTTG